MKVLSSVPWVEGRLDALAFAAGLVMAWFFKWQTRALVWSLWLSSLVVGYATIVWTLTRPWRIADGAAVGESSRGVAGVLLMLVFFTVHFGGFHLGHSVFLNLFFPVDDALAQDGGLPGLPAYAQVLKQYWVFVPLAFIAERMTFSDRAATLSTVPAGPRASKPSGEALTAPYRNVIRMHLLIFFFAAVYFLGAEHFFIYAVVYAAYFFPWRLLKRRPASSP